jgi:hypothetical protein
VDALTNAGRADDPGVPLVVLRTGEGDVFPPEEGEKPFIPRGVIEVYALPLCLPFFPLPLREVCPRPPLEDSSSSEYSSEENEVESQDLNTVHADLRGTGRGSCVDIVVAKGRKEEQSSHYAFYVSLLGESIVPSHGGG